MERFLSRGTPGSPDLTRDAAGAVSPSQGRPGTPESLQPSIKTLDERMRGMLAHLQAAMPEYQYSPPITFGGPTTALYGAYRLPSEFATPAQYCVMVASFQGAGALSIGQDEAALAPAATAAIDPSIRQRSQVITSATATTIPLSEFWLDLPGAGMLYLATNVASSDAAYVTVQFRRRVNHHNLYDEGHN